MKFVYQAFLLRIASIFSAVRSLAASNLPQADNSKARTPRL